MTLMLRYLKVLQIANKITPEFIGEDKQDLYERLHWFNERYKHQKLSFDQRRWIKNILDISKLTITEVQTKFHISYSVLKRIKRCLLSQFNLLNSRRIIKVNNRQKEALMNAIKEFMKLTGYAITAK